MFLIVSALKSELQFILNHCEQEEVIGQAPFSFTKCKFNNFRFILGKCGLGKVRPASFIQYSICKFDKLNIIVNFGSAGLLDKDGKIGDIYLCTKTVEHDFYTTRKFIPQFESNVDIASDLLEKFNIKKGVLVSGTQNVDSQDKRNYLIKQYNASLADWEGSSIMQVAKLNNVKCIVLKSITDYGNENILSDFEKYHKDVLDKNSLKLLKFLEELSNCL